MNFGMTGAPGSFQKYINDVLREGLDQYYTVYIDNILIFSKNLKEYKEYVIKVLKRL